MRLVVALGGNALAAGDARERDTRLARTADELTLLSRDHELVVTHGNGPQVGELLLDMAARREHPGRADEQPLDVLVAMTQGQLGYRLQQALETSLARAGAARSVVAVVTQVRVRPDDPAFSRPTKPVGPRFDERPSDAAAYAETMDGKWRRVVPSPAPVEVLGAEPLRRLLDDGVIPICLGGGGVPVVREGGRLIGVDAVIDKDLASALLVEALGADGLLILTDVDGVQRDHGSPDATTIRELTAADAEALLASLEPGSIGPKLSAAAMAARAGRFAAIGRLGQAASVLAGVAGTLVTDGERGAVVSSGP